MSSQRRKPEWLGVRLPSGEEYFKVVKLLKDTQLNTVCQEANCPNIAECFNKKTATFMILGNICTRNCRYCNVIHDLPQAVDLSEPGRVARAVKELDLSYVVVTSVTRDDLDDGGAGIFAETISEIKSESPNCKVEVLIPDFQGDTEAIESVIGARPEVINHNIEVVSRLFPQARPDGDYELSLWLLGKIKDYGLTSKSGFMVGLGETKDEIIDTMDDLCSVTDILTIGQYLRPTDDHLPVAKYYKPEEFEELKAIGLDMGFKHVESGPLVRSSYHAKEYVV